MALTPVTATWTAITLTKDEIWMAQQGAFMVHCFNGAAPSTDDGGTIQAGDSIRFATGQTVYHRSAFGREGLALGFARIEVSA